ncbi:hypothetical protein L6164_007560 [Bauhinia variegata]|uniref:Uncharacterized protein n=1 Tax=Bauhinia variegata TaxID=167791 RepID=A0ACB9PDY3_BAUVA|nr:hypothetical protein L6164_007560 [Bauhinia variegata]
MLEHIQGASLHKYQIVVDILTKNLAKEDKILVEETNNERCKMNKSPKKSDFPEKQEVNANAKASSSSAQWLRLKDPRIVRVSRAFGGKDRHSKVCTIRGLRDRRVRLSVPTAIQLYDLQDRLGLNQPSKVIDWLLNEAKNEIDELPPLPMLPAGNFSLSPYPSAIASHAVSASHPNQERFNINGTTYWEDPSDKTSWKSKSKEVLGETVPKKENWTSRSNEENNKQGSNNESHGAQVLPNNLLQRANHPSLLGLPNIMPLGYQWEHPGDSSESRNHGLTSQTDLSTGTSQILVCTPGVTQSYFPSNVTAIDMDPREINHYHQMLSSNSQNLLTDSLSPSIYPVSQSVKPFSLSIMPTKLLQYSPNSESQYHKDGNFPSK